MAREWSDLFIVDGAAAVAAEAPAVVEEKRMGRFRRLRENLRKIRQAKTAANLDGWANSPGLKPPI